MPCLHAFSFFAPLLQHAELELRAQLRQTVAAAAHWADGADSRRLHGLAAHQAPADLADRRRGGGESKLQI